MHRFFFYALTALCLTVPALAQDPAPPATYPAVPLLSTSTTIVGEPIRYPQGEAHVTPAFADAPAGSSG